MLWYWFPALPALFLALLSLRGERKRTAYVLRRLSEVTGTLPPATVIVPIKGHDYGLKANLAALASLDYPDYELIVAAHSAADIPPGILPKRAKIVLSHGEDPETSEKVQNLLAAVRAVRQRTEVLAFADSDGVVPGRWLRALVAPLSEPGVGASTGFRWFAPAPAGFWSLMRGVWDAASSGLLGPGDNPFAWGGAMAIRKETFFDIRVPEHWKKVVSDDYALAEAVHAAGLTIAYAPGALTPCCERTSAVRFFSWMRRQMTITRIHSPRLWSSALLAHVVYCAGMAAGAAASVKGSRVAGFVLLAQLAPGMWKGFRRAAMARAALPERAAWFRRWQWAHAVGTPAATWLWLIALVSSAFGSTIEWRGNRYYLRRRARSNSYNLA